MEEEAGSAPVLGGDMGLGYKHTDFLENTRDRREPSELSDSFSDSCSDNCEPTLHKFMETYHEICFNLSTVLVSTFSRKGFSLFLVSSEFA